MRPFEPVPGATLKVANAVAATALADLPSDCNVVALYNADTAAVAFFRCQPSDIASVALIDKEIPVPPGQLIRISVPFGKKQFSVIASAATGNLYVTPGRGD